MASSTRALLISFFLAGLTLAACGGSVETTTTGTGGQSSTGTSTGTGASTGTSTGTGASTGTSTGTGGASGDCASDADCPAGQCVPLAPGGYKVCTHVPAEAKSCTMPPGPVKDQCCTSGDCAPGKCYASSSLPYCGGPAMPEYNVCIADACASDADCIHDNPTPWICIPAGAFGYPNPTCFTAYCHTNADCTAQGAGTCAPIANPCCSVPQGLACVYAGGCTKDSDCASDGSKHCGIDPSTGSAVCLPGFVGCPA